MLADKAADALDCRVGQLLVDRHLHSGHRFGRAGARRSLPVEQFHRRALVDVHWCDVDTAADATFHQIEVVRHVRAVLIIDVRAAFWNMRNCYAGNIAEHLIVDFCVAARSLDELRQLLQSGEADRGLHVRESTAVVRWQGIQPPHAFPELLLRFRSGERCDVPDWKQREREYARADEGMLDWKSTR